MAYATYTTNAIVCGAASRHAADKSYTLFTEGAGMLHAVARSVREERSRQRYALQEFSHVRVSLIRGRHGWRIGSVATTTNFYSACTGRAQRAGVRRVILLLRQFLHGETAHPDLFADTCAALSCLTEAPASKQAGVVDAFTLRLLFYLGYVAPHSSLTPILAGEGWLAGKEVPAAAQTAIKEAFAASQLA